VPNRFAFSGATQLLRLLDAVMAISSEQTLADALRAITQAAADLVDARYAALGVLDESGSRLAEFITVGLDPEETARIGARPQGHGILGLLILDPVPLRLPDLHAHPDSFGFPPGHPPMTSFLGVPIRMRGVAYGNLYLTDKADGQPFSDVDQELAVGLAAAAGLAIENARLHEQARLAGLLDERERIARDLHDDVIQRLFATGMSLQAVAHMIDDPVAEQRIVRAVDELDVSIRQVRSTIFELRQTSTTRRSLRSEILTICEDASRTLGFRPSCDVRGPIDNAVGKPLGGQLLLCLREGLSNVARHARATHVAVEVLVDRGRLVLRVSDDGIGYVPTPGATSSGLGNMRVRAEASNGSFSIEPCARGGVMITWDVSLGPLEGDGAPGEEVSAAPS
jgi:signal transduction histidine kinase